MWRIKDPEEAAFRGQDQRKEKNVRRYIHVRWPISQEKKNQTPKNRYIYIVITVDLYLFNWENAIVISSFIEAQ